MVIMIMLMMIMIMMMINIPATNASKIDFLVMLSPAGAGQYLALRKRSIVLVALTTPLHA
jgi:hypothetical protein